MLSAHQLSRVCREPGYILPDGGDAKAFVVVPTGCARRAVAKYHSAGEAAAKHTLSSSKVGEWATHVNPSMRSANQAVLDGFDWYCERDKSVGLPMHALDVEVDINLPSGPLHVRVDVVLKHGTALAGRVVLWDRPGFEPDDAPTLAYPFAAALAVL